jgi:tetratricopeptide (TPR) repeat protein
LSEKDLPVGERDVPWYWPLQYWLPQNFETALNKHIGQGTSRRSDKSVELGMKALLAERPYLTQLFPHMLEFGDRSTREFVMNLIRLVKTPEMLQLLYDFGQGRYGSDDLRFEALQVLSQDYSEMLPDDKKVKMWINGQEAEVFLLGFEITYESELVAGVSDEIQDKHTAAYEYLMDDEPEKAEAVLQEIIAAAPHFYSAYNQLAVAYQMQGRHKEARAIMEQTHAQFPDYLFARVGLARMLIQDKRIEDGRKLLEPLMQLKKLHISEFKALASAQMDLALAEKKPESARTWLGMWEEIEEDDPQLFDWQMRINGPQFLQELEDYLREMKREKRTKKRR